MKRIRFHTIAEDWRPINWPIKHPYWKTGESEIDAILVSYADDEDYIYTYWPEATELDVMDEEVEEYTFTDRFPKPDWFEVDCGACGGSQTIGDQLCYKCGGTGKER